jgi:hypothetical protein
MGSNGVVKKDFAKMACVWVDMERGLYDWGDMSQPKTRSGKFRVVKARILEDFGITKDYHDARNRIWEHPRFKAALSAERLRRDHGLVEVVQEMEEKGAPVSGIGNKIVELVKERLDADPDELSTKELLQYGPQWVRLGLELDGKVKGVQTQKIEMILQKVENKLDPEMLSDVMEKIRAHNVDKQKRLGLLIEGEVDE